MWAAVAEIAAQSAMIARLLLCIFGCRLCAYYYYLYKMPKVRARPYVAISQTKVLSKCLPVPSKILFRILGLHKIHDSGGSEGRPKDRPGKVIRVGSLELICAAPVFRSHTRTATPVSAARAAVPESRCHFPVDHGNGFSSQPWPWPRAGRSTS